MDNNHTKPASLAILGTRGIPARHGGFETFAEKLAIFLVGKGWEVDVYCQTDRQEEPYFWNGIRLVPMRAPGDSAFSTIVFDLLATLHCLKNDRLPLVLGYNTAWLSIFYRLTGRRSVMNMDGIEWRRDRWPKYVKAWFWLNERLGCYLSNHLIADHPEILRHLATRVRTSKISLIAGGLAAQLTIAALQFITGSELRIQGGNVVGNGRVLVFEQADGLHVSRVSGTLLHPNNFADYLTFVLPPLIVMLLLGRRMVGTLVWNISAVLSVGAMVALILALSRAGWIAFGCSLAFIFVAGSWFGIVRTSHFIALAVIAGSLAGGISAFFPAAIYRVILSDSRSGDSRIAMMDQALLIIERSPLLGVGLAGYNKAAQTVTPSSWAVLQPDFREALRKGSRA
jgi:hypothetical protein